jgi:hypothetical protein
MRRKRSESTVMEGISPQRVDNKRTNKPKKKKKERKKEKKKRRRESRKKERKGNPRIEEVGMMGQEVGGGIG